MARHEMHVQQIPCGCLELILKHPKYLQPNWNRISNLIEIGNTICDFVAASRVERGRQDVIWGSSLVGLRPCYCRLKLWGYVCTGHLLMHGTTKPVTQWQSGKVSCTKVAAMGDSILQWLRVFSTCSKARMPYIRHGFASRTVSRYPNGVYLVNMRHI